MQEPDERGHPLSRRDASSAKKAKRLEALSRRFIDIVFRDIMATLQENDAHSLAVKNPPNPLIS
jgi:hypothetical protein